MANYAIITDLNRCTGCLACTVACKAINGVDVGQFWIKPLRVGPNPTGKVVQAITMWKCISSRAVPAKSQNASGVPHRGVPYSRRRHVQIDKSKCIGCRFCAMVAPYGGVRTSTRKNASSRKCIVRTAHRSKASFPMRCPVRRSCTLLRRS